jgi:DMSO reductase anchor subunit
VALFGLYGGLAALTLLIPVAAPLTVAVGVAGVYASGRLYVVPGRPAWHTRLTIVRFGATALAVGPLLTGHPRWALVGIALQVLATAANLVRLQRDPRIEWWGSVRLTLGWFRVPFVLAGLALAGGLVAAALGVLLVALPLVVAGELVGRYLFYVTVVPLDMPGSFARSSKGHR